MRWAIGAIAGVFLIAFFVGLANNEHLEDDATTSVTEAGSDESAAVNQAEGGFSPPAAPTTVSEVTSTGASWQTISGNASPQPEEAEDKDSRRASGEGQALRFEQGTPVAGAVIEYDTGKAAYECYDYAAHAGGQVISGVIFPWEEEIAGLKACDPQPMGSGDSGQPAGHDDPRQETGIGGSLYFASGTPISGAEIYYNDGQVAYGCYDQSAHVDGVVITGVLFPWQEEVAQSPYCEPYFPQEVGPASDPRKATGVDQSLRFEAGIPVVGAVIEYDSGKVAYDCYDYATHTSGTVTSGVIYPWEGEYAGKKHCNPQPIDSQPPAQPTPAPPPAEPTPTPTPDPRQPTGDGNSLNFAAGTPVLGAHIAYSDGQEAFNCFDPSPHTGGSVTSGVIHPWPEESGGMQHCNPQFPEPDPTPTPEPEPTTTPDPRQVTGVGGSLYFAAGTPVTGWKIVLDDGSEHMNCSFASAPMGGTVYDGVIYPWEGEFNSPCITEPEEAPPSGNRLTTADNGGPIRFSAGTPVIGSVITLDDGQEFHGCYLVAPTSGTVQDGVIFPWEDEITATPSC